MSARSRLVVIAAVGVLGAGAAVVAAFAFEQEFDATKVSEVATLAQQESTMPAAAAIDATVDGIGFPNWSRWGWNPVGGRIDDLEDSERRMITVRYRKGSNRIAYSIVSGTDDVNSDRGTVSSTRTPPGGKVGLDVSAVGPDVEVVIPGDCGDGPCRVTSGIATTVKRRINGRTLILTAWPESAELSREAQDMALRTKR